jgi:uncharacterized damage-inducible protein DinB
MACLLQAIFYSRNIPTMKRDELLKKWKGNKRYTLKVLEAMPDDRFDFKPADQLKSFKSQASHISSWLRTWSRFVTDTTLEKRPSKTKSDIQTSLSDLFDRLIDFLGQAEEHQLEAKLDTWFGKVSKESILLTMDNHLSHHRAQMVMYLRMNDIKAPSYVGW